MTNQLSFDLAVNVSLGADDFFVSTANQDAYSMVTGSIEWPSGKLVLVGSSGAGKSHLARVWQGLSGAFLVSAADLQNEETVPPTTTALIIEDMDELSQDAEEIVFHFHNRLAQSSGRLLMTARQAPSRWPILLPDLASRMQATTIVRMSDPDDRLLSAILTKLFADRQLSPAPEIISMLVARIERSFGAAADVVAALDSAALAEGREINRPLVRDVLDKLADRAR
ncbi:MAG: DnaA/Hda family protein [Rhodobacterales bacterium]|nr:DnaA/Hda family protein [Rhodobacterales bacterium]